MALPFTLPCPYPELGTGVEGIFEAAQMTAGRGVAKQMQNIG